MEQNLHYGQLITDITQAELRQISRPQARYYDVSHDPAMYVWPSNYNLNVVYAYPNYSPIGGGKPVVPLWSWQVRH